MEVINVDSVIQHSVLKKRKASKRDLLKKTQLLRMISKLKRSYPVTFLHTIDPCITEEELSEELTTMIKKGITNNKLIESDPIWN